MASRNEVIAVCEPSAREFGETAERVSVAESVESLSAVFHRSQHYPVDKAAAARRTTRLESLHGKQCRLLSINSASTRSDKIHMAAQRRVGRARIRSGVQFRVML